jgi:DNA-binding transcriptional LysR family regulator
MAGLGISILSEHTLSFGGSSGLVELDIAELPIESTWYLVRLASRRLSLVAQAFLDYLRKEGAANLRAEHAEGLKIAGVFAAMEQE